MPRTMLVLPTSTTRRLDIANRLLRHDQLAGADGQHFAAVAKLRAALLVDADPRSARGAVADDGGDAVARFVNRIRPPLVEDRFSVERHAQPPVDMLDELLGRSADAVESFGDLADGDRVRPRLVFDRLHVDADADQQVRAIVLHARFDEDAGDFLAADEDVVRPLDLCVDRKYIT